MVGADRIDSNACGAVVDGSCARQANHTVLGSAVGGHVRKPCLRRLAGNVNNPSPAPRGFHVGGGDLSTMEYSTQSDINHQIPFIR